MTEGDSCIVLNDTLHSYDEECSVTVELMQNVYIITGIVVGAWLLILSIIL